MELQRQKDALFHDGTDKFCHMEKDGKSYKFTLRVAKNSVDMAFFCVETLDTQMYLARSDENFDYYEVVKAVCGKDDEENPDEKNSEAVNILKYHFRAESSEGVIYYDALGACDEYFPEREFKLRVGFFTPDWAKGAVMYQIMVDRFCNGDEENDVLTNEYSYIGRHVKKADDWYELPHPGATWKFYGGDLKGVIDKLDYLKNLGVEVIYFNPLFVSPSNHKYDIQDYDHIDPHFGKIVKDGGDLLKPKDINNRHASKYKARTTKKANLTASDLLFAELVEKAHEYGIRVIIDGVFNHCGSFSRWMNKEKIYGKRKKTSEGKPIEGAFESKESPYVDYFDFKKDDWPGNGSYDAWWGFDTLPKLNYENSEELCRYIIDIGRKWVSPPYNADGWRLDVAADLGHVAEFNHDFWRRFRKAVKEANPEAIILAEHYGDAGDWLLGDQWDTVMNYDGFMDPVSWFLTGVDKHSDNASYDMMGDAKAFNDTYNYQMSLISNESLLTAMNELSNHDHSRFMTRTNHTTGRVETLGADAASKDIDRGIFKQGVVMQMTLPGAPTLYYGDEAGLCGWTDPDNRRTYPWGREDVELLEFCRESIDIHRKNQALKTGSYLPLVEDEGLVGYGRFLDDEAVITIINTKDYDRDVSVPVWRLGTINGSTYERIMETGRDFYNCGRVRTKQDEDFVNVSIKPKSAAIYRYVKRG